MTLKIKPLAVLVLSVILLSCSNKIKPMNSGYFIRTMPADQNEQNFDVKIIDTVWIEKSYMIIPDRMHLTENKKDQSTYSYQIIKYTFIDLNKNIAQDYHSLDENQQPYRHYKIDCSSLLAFKTNCMQQGDFPLAKNEIRNTHLIDTVINNQNVMVRVMKSEFPSQPEIPMVIYKQYFKKDNLVWPYLGEWNKIGEKQIPKGYTFYKLMIIHNDDASSSDEWIAYESKVNNSNKIKKIFTAWAKNANETKLPLLSVEEEKTTCITIVEK